MPDNRDIHPMSDVYQDEAPGFYPPRWRLARLTTDQEFNDTLWNVVVMTQPYSYFAHVVFQGSFDECLEFLDGIPIEAY